MQESYKLKLPGSDSVAVLLRNRGKKRKRNKRGQALRREKLDMPMGRVKCLNFTAVCRDTYCNRELYADITEDLQREVAEGLEKNDTLLNSHLLIDQQLSIQPIQEAKRWQVREAIMQHFQLIEKIIFSIA